MITLTDSDKAFLAPIHEVIDIIAGHHSQANFRMTIAESQSRKIFHDILKCFKGSEIEPSRFIGIHAIAECINQAKGFGGGTAKVHLEILGVAKEVLDEETYAQLNAWVKGFDLDATVLSTEDKWSKLGALTHHLDRLSMLFISDMEPEIWREHLNVLEDLHSDSSGFLDACKGVNQALEELFLNHLVKLEENLTLIKSLPALPPKENGLSLGME